MRENKLHNKMNWMVQCKVISLKKSEANFFIVLDIFPSSCRVAFARLVFPGAAMMRLSLGGARPTIKLSGSLSVLVKRRQESRSR